MDDYSDLIRDLHRRTSHDDTIKAADALKAQAAEIERLTKAQRLKRKKTDDRSY